ncbi:hypothetical protein JW960_13885 [candidate division KSB1 bacterium]|nr:hypothetical protein [candidate division KSB1 bacterium]
MSATISEILRIKYKYRKLIMEGKIKLPYKDAARLIGPDCAYHLYSQFHPEASESDELNPHGDQPAIPKSNNH